MSLHSKNTMYDVFNNTISSNIRNESLSKTLYNMKIETTNKSKYQFSLNRLFDQNIIKGDIIENFKLKFNQSQLSKIGSRHIRSISNEHSRAQRVLQPISQPIVNSQKHYISSNIESLSKFNQRAYDIKSRLNEKRVADIGFDKEDKRVKKKYIRKASEAEYMLKANTDVILSLKANIFNIYELDLINCQDSKISVGNIKRD